MRCRLTPEFVEQWCHDFSTTRKPPNALTLSTVDAEEMQTISRRYPTVKRLAKESDGWLVHALYNVLSEINLNKIRKICKTLTVSLKFDVGRMGFSLAKWFGTAAGGFALDVLLAVPFSRAFGAARRIFSSSTSRAIIWRLQ